MNASHQANDLIRLRTMSSFWGDIFSGTKAQLNEIGFGAGCLFPGEPLAAKRTCRLPLAHGYARVEVRLGWMEGPQSEKPFEARIFSVDASHLADDSERKRRSVPFAPGVTVTENRLTDTYTGTAQALILAGLIEERQLPGMPGCGRCTTTFDACGNIFERKSHPDWRQEGFKTVRKYGKKITVHCVVSIAIHELRKKQFDQKQSAYELACMEAKHAKQVQQNTPRPRPNLRLVWSV